MRSRTHFWSFWFCRWLPCYGRCACGPLFLQDMERRKFFEGKKLAMAFLNAFCFLQQIVMCSFLLFSTSRILWKSKTQVVEVWTEVVIWERKNGKRAVLILVFLRTESGTRDPGILSFVKDFVFCSCQYFWKVSEVFPQYFWKSFQHLFCFLRFSCSSWVISSLDSPLLSSLQGKVVGRGGQKRLWR